MGTGPFPAPRWQKQRWQKLRRNRGNRYIIHGKLGGLNESWLRKAGNLMIVRHSIFLAGLVGMIALTAAGARADLVVNGDFANVGNVWVNNTGLGSDDWQTGGATAIPDWTNVAGAANEFWVTSPNDYSGLTASPGNGSTFFVDLTGQANNLPYGGLEQTIATTSGDSYVLHFDLGASTVWDNPNPAALIASATGTSLLASKLFTLTPTSDNTWATETLDFTADSSSTTIEFLGDSNYTSRYIGLDNASVAAVTSTVPEPATWPILIGLIGLGALLRSRRKQVAATN
jgi:hypothetical protein